MEKYEMVREIGSGSFGVSRLLRNKLTKELVAVKFLKRGPKIDHNVVREIINHRILRHPNVIRFKEVVLTPTHLGISMEYGAGGTILERVQNAGRFTEDEARYFFQQLISGVNYCHSLEVSHRDLKLENTLLDGSPAPRLKICDFGFSTNSKARATVGTPAYMAPEVFSQKEYDGKIVDVWSCGVILYVFLVGEYPFENREDPGNLDDMIKRIVQAQYSIPGYIELSQDCRYILSRIFVANPNTRITLEEIKRHPWFLKNLPRELTEAAQAMYYKKEFYPSQSLEKIIKIIKEARVPPSVSFAKDVNRKRTDDFVNDANAKLATDDSGVDSDVDNDLADEVGRMHLEEDDAEARATKLVEESKTLVDDILKLIFSGKENILGTRATKLDQGETPAKDDRLALMFSSESEEEDLMGPRATKLVHTKSAEEIWDSESSSNAQEMDILGGRATELVQSKASNWLASLINFPSFSYKEDLLGAKATKQSISRTSSC